MVLFYNKSNNWFGYGKILFNCNSEYNIVIYFHLVNKIRVCVKF